jgi:hypothetical protein
MACLSGSYIVWMLFIMFFNMFLSVEYLHSMSWRHLPPLYMMSSTTIPCGFIMYPIALMMYGLCCLGLLCFGNSVVGILMVGCFVVLLSFCSPSCVGSSTSNKREAYLHVLRLKSYKVNTAKGTVRGTIYFIFRKCDPSYGHSPCSSSIFGTVSAVYGLSTSVLQCNIQSI